MANKKPNPNHNMVNIKSNSEQRINDHKLASKQQAKKAAKKAARKREKTKTNEGKTRLLPSFGLTRKLSCFFLVCNGLGCLLCRKYPRFEYFFNLEAKAI